MVGSLVLHMWISQDFHHQFSPIIILTASLPAPSGARIHHFHRVKSGRILTPTWQTDITVVSLGSRIPCLSVITEAAERTLLRTGTMMAGALTTTGGTAGEREDGAQLGTNKCAQHVVL